jgi:hypothetical protein
MQKPQTAAHLGPEGLALAIGLISSLVLFGPGFFFNHSPYLTVPLGDVAAEMGGYFRTMQDSWRFPLRSANRQRARIYAMAFVVATMRDGANAASWLSGDRECGSVRCRTPVVVVARSGRPAPRMYLSIGVRRRAADPRMDRRLCAEPMPMSSYGTLGFNVGSLVIPHQSILFPGWPILYDWWGGDFHLGAGIIGLWASFLLFSPKAIGGPLVRNWPLAVLLFFFALFCVSNHVNFGATTLFTYPLPQFVAPVIGMARAGGRLFWPIGYLLIATPLALTIQRHPKRASTVIVAVALSSILEASGTYAFLQSRISTAQPVAVNYDG